MSHRLFVAIRPPTHIRDALLDTMDGVDGARWQDETQVHLTLRFIGEIERPLAEDMAEALAAVRAPAFDLAIAGVGVFERKGVPHTLWAGLTPSDPLVRLQRKIERVCQRRGLPAETRRFAPHITLARLNRASGPVCAFLARHAGLAAGPWRVEEFGLYESHLSRNGARYEPVACYTLDE